MMRLVTTTALALALAAPGYAVLAQETSPGATDDATSAGGASGGVYMAKAEKTDVFGSDFIGKDVYVKESAGQDAQTEASQEMSEAQSDANAEMADAQEDASEEMADAQDEGAEETAEARQDANQDLAEGQADAQEEIAEGQEEANDEMAAADDGPEWESIGEVSDVVMTREGEVKAILVDVGGFLGMGAKTVAITMDDLAWQTEEGDDEPFLTLKADRAALENAPEFEKNPDAGDDAQQTGMGDTAAPTAATTGAAGGAGASMTGASDTAMGTPPAADDSSAENAMDEAASETADAADDAAESVEQAAEDTGEAVDEAATETAQATDEATDEAAQTAQGGADRLTKMDAAGYRQVEAAGLTAESIAGATVYDMGNEDIGEVVDLVLSDDGAMDEAIIDVGGFLGLGEHRVAVRMNDLKIMQADDDPEDVRVYVASTKDELEAMPEVETDG